MVLTAIPQDSRQASLKGVWGKNEIARNDRRKRAMMGKIDIPHLRVNV